MASPPIAIYIGGMFSALRLVACAGFLVLLAPAVHAACSNPTGDEGKIIYNADYKIPQYCNGTDWIAWGSGWTENWAKSGSDLYYNGGNVGIGTASPGTTFDVNGDTELRGTLTGGRSNGSNNFHIDAYNSGSGQRGIYLNYFTGTGVYLAGGAAVTSDARKKKNINTLENSLDKIARLRGVTYQWSDPNRDQSGQVGVIAQEVQIEYPQLVNDDGYGTLTVQYSALVAPLIEAVKELKAQVDAQAKEIDALKASRP